MAIRLIKNFPADMEQEDEVALSRRSAIDPYSEMVHSISILIIRKLICDSCCIFHLNLPVKKLHGSLFTQR
jgi:hypothetical protein